jgi:hypothetical protein
MRVPTVLRAVALGALGGAVMFVVGAIPTAVVANSWFTRMTLVRPLDIVFLIVSVLGAALIAATYASPVTQACGGENRVLGGGLLSVLAIGCPVCNKLVVLALGFSGALTYFAPLQPVLGVASVALMGVVAYQRLSALHRTQVLTTGS